MKATTTKTHTREFRANAVRLATLPGKTITSVAIELGVPSWKLRNWIKEGKDKLERSSEIDELIALQKRIKELEEENLILKKAAAYFAKNLA
jgi:transposase